MSATPQDGQAAGLLPGAVVAAELDELLDKHGDELVAIRRHLHRHPERSYQEHATTDFVAQRLEASGFAPRVLSIGTGLVCDVPVSATRPTVALRADLDALAMDDEKDVPYRSEVPGVAHTCGHDVHTTIVLGAGLALARLLRQAGPEAGPVRLIFQPAEESAPGGARDVIADGALDGVEWIFGLHCDPKLDAGTFGVREGAITSAADLVEIDLHGPGGHTARPQLAVDLVAVAARVALEAPGRLRARDPALSLVFGALRTGDAANVIPALATIRGTVRTPHRAAWAGAAGELAAVLDEIVPPLGARHELAYTQGPPPVENDPDATALLGTAAVSAVGTGNVVGTPQSAGGDDFSWYLELDGVRGSYGRLGVRPPDARGPSLDLHASTFDVDESVIGVGVRILVHAALAALTRTG